MKNKNGFTLVELLAVIAILAILVIIALPNVMDMFNNAKKSAFETEVKQIFKLSKSEWMNDSLGVSSEKIYSQCDNGCNNPIKSMDVRSNLNYYVKISGTGKVTDFYVTDGTFQYSYNGEELKQEDIKDVKIIANLNDSEILNISEIEESSGKSNTCNYKIVANGPGSFSENETVNELCFDIEDDGYVFKSSSSSIVRNNKLNNNYFQVLVVDGKPSKDTSIKVYSDSTKSTLLAKFDSNDIKDENRYSLNNYNNYLYANTNVKKIGNNTRTDYYVETSNDVCFGTNCDKPVNYYYGYSSYISEINYTGPWIKNSEITNKIKYFETSLKNSYYKFAGFTKCKPRFPGDSQFYNESDCTGNIYYIKYSDTRLK